MGLQVNVHKSVQGAVSGRLCDDKCGTAILRPGRPGDCAPPGTRISGPAADWVTVALAARPLRNRRRGGAGEAVINEKGRRTGMRRPSGFDLDRRYGQGCRWPS